MGSPGMAGKVRSSTILLLLVGGLMAASGCVHLPSNRLTSRPKPTPTLLFDRYSGHPTASRMAVRSDWPSTVALYPFGEAVLYRERFIDIQGGGQQGQGRLAYTYRRFDTYRMGGATR